MAHKENYKRSASLIHHQHITLYGVRCLNNTYFMTIKKKKNDLTANTHALTGKQ